MDLDENTEIVNNHRGKFAEGSCNLEPSKEDVSDYLLQRNYLAYNIDISWDNLQGFWRWYADITATNDI